MLCGPLDGTFKHNYIPRNHKVKKNNQEELSEVTDFYIINWAFVRTCLVIRARERESPKFQVRFQLQTLVRPEEGLGKRLQIVSPQCPLPMRLGRFPLAQVWISTGF